MKKTKKNNKNRVPKQSSKTPQTIVKGTLLFLLFYVANKIGEAFSIINTTDTLKKLQNIGRALPVVFQNPLPSVKSQALIWGFASLFIVYMIYQNIQAKKKKMRDGREHGSAQWGTAAELEPFIDPKFEENIILSETELLRMTSMDMKYISKSCNKNVLVVGGSGSGKTRFYVKPNLMQMHSSYVITDPKGSILPECGKMLKKGHYIIKVLNLINFSKSMHYNPLSYVHTQLDIDKLTHTLLVNRIGEDYDKDFFSQQAGILITALIAYVCEKAPLDRRNFGNIMDMLNDIKLKEADNWTDEVTAQFNTLESEKNNHYAVRMYRKFKANGEGKTAQSILGSAHAVMKVFENDSVRDLLASDDLAIDTVGDKKTALFVIIPDTDTTFNFIVAIMYTQMFNLLCTKADDEHGGRLPKHVRFLLDEFANIGKIPMFEVLITTIRSREISVSIVLQTKSQLKAQYKDHAETISGNCDSFLFLGGKEASTIKDISEMLGKETIDTRNTSENRGRDKSFGTSFQRTGVELMAMNDIATMDGGKCIVQIKGCNPFFSKKFDITGHSRYQELSDYDKKNTFDIEKYMKGRGCIRVKQGDKITVVEL